MSTKVPVPKKKVITIVCSLCDEPWDDHGDDPTVLDCIRLLKAKAEKPVRGPAPTVVPYYPWNNSWGYTCAMCGAWVLNSRVHYCARVWSGTTTNRLQLTSGNALSANTETDA